MATEILEYHNVLLYSILNEAIVEGDEPNYVNQVVSDFDSVKFHISTPDSKTQIVVSMRIKSWPDLKKYGVEKVMAREYGPYIVDPEPGYDFSVLIDLNNLPDSPTERAELVQNLSLMRRNAMAAPFELAFSRFDKMAKEAKENGLDYYQGTAQDREVLAIHYRDHESIFVQPNFDRVTVIFSTVFVDETDQTFGKVFLQEFVDARKRAIQSAPQVLFTREPPLELKEFNLRTASDVGYITFVLFPSHITSRRREQTISHIQTFRDYFHYHIKSSKAYVHSRMRHRTSEFLKVLNRAKPENVEKERKTASGRRLRHV